MATYAGFAPGNYNAWALNLLPDVFCTPGVGRGMAVTAPGGMSVTVGVDAVAQDGMVVLPNGGWLRIDQAVTFTVPSNSSGSTRNDAIVAFMDPTGVANPVFSLTYNSNWAGGFTGNNNNQWVVATVAVPNGAVGIAQSNITVNPQLASFGGNRLLDPNTHMGIQVTDSTAGHRTYITTTAATPDYRGIIFQTQTTAGVLSTVEITETGATALNMGLYLHPDKNTQADDALIMYDRNGTYGGVMGVQQSNGGFYLFDAENNGYVYQSATKNSIVFGGTIKQGASAQPVAVSGTHSTAQINVSFGNGTPASLASNEVFFQFN